MIQIGKSEDSSNIYLSFCIKKDELDTESVECINAVTKQIMNHLSNLIVETSTSLRTDTTNTSYYTNKLTNYAKVMDVISVARTSIEGAINGSQEDCEEESSTEEETTSE